MGQSEHEAELVNQLTGIQLALRQYISSLMPGDSASADITQQTNTTIWNKRDDFQPGTNFKAWAFAIARYEVLNHRRRQIRENRHRVTFSEELENTITSELTHLAEGPDNRQAALRNCLEKLKAEERNLIHQRYFSSISLDELSGRTGRSVGSLKVTLFRVRQKLLTCIERNLQPSPPVS